MDLLSLFILFSIAGLYIYIFYNFQKISSKQSSGEGSANFIKPEDLYQNLNKQTQSLQLDITRLSTQITQEVQTRFFDIQEKNNQKFQLIQKDIGTGQIEAQKQITEILAKISEQIVLVSRQELSKIEETTSKQLKNLQELNHKKLEEINQEVQRRLDSNFEKNLKSVEQVINNLTKIQGSAQQMLKASESVDKLNQVFSRTSSKAYGGFAEDYLQSLLSENLAPNSWQKQVKVPGAGEIIDFILVIGDQRVGIDAKFPLAKYQDYLDSSLENRDKAKKEYLKAVQAMAKDIASKYLKVGFIDNLLLYLPSDSMYSEAVNDIGLINSLHKYQVQLTSPATLFPLIMLINAYQYKQNINQNAEKIILGLKEINRNVAGFKEEFRKLGDKIRQAQDNYDKADRNLLGVEKNIIALDTSTEPNNQVSLLTNDQD